MRFNDFRLAMDLLYTSGRVCEGLVMNSGLRMSVQASESHYCTPRMDLDSYTEYYEFEVGFPTERVEDFMEYAEDTEHPTGTVYAYVPYEVIQKVIDENGGLKDFEK